MAYAPTTESTWHVVQARGVADDRQAPRPGRRQRRRRPDSFQNFSARIGLGTENLQSPATYGFNPITRNRQLLEWMYGGSWIVGKASTRSPRT
jgi:hypothetical protein